MHGRRICRNSGLTSYGSSRVHRPRTSFGGLQFWTLAGSHRRAHSGGLVLRTEAIDIELAYGDYPLTSFFPLGVVDIEVCQRSRVHQHFAWLSLLSLLVVDSGFALHIDDFQLWIRCSGIRVQHDLGAVRQTPPFGGY